MQPPIMHAPLWDYTLMSQEIRKRLCEKSLHRSGFLKIFVLLWPFPCADGAAHPEKMTKIRR
jgi:hypothetical protein